MKQSKFRPEEMKTQFLHQNGDKVSNVVLGSFYNDKLIKCIVYILF